MPSNATKLIKFYFHLTFHGLGHMTAFKMDLMELINSYDVYDNKKRKIKLPLIFFNQ